MYNNEKLLRSDVHPLALLDSEHPITECMTCQLPVPEEAQGKMYCDEACENTALENALWNSAIADANARASAESLFGEMFPEIAAMSEPSMPLAVQCSCPNH